MDSVYVIYKDGKRLDKDQSSRTIKVAYLKKGSASSVITQLINSHIRWTLDLSEIYEHERWKREEEKERQRYEIVEYVRKQK
jgi:hypothetical protein